MPVVRYRPLKQEEKQNRYHALGIRVKKKQKHLSFNANMLSVWKPYLMTHETTYNKLQPAMVLGAASESGTKFKGRRGKYFYSFFCQFLTEWQTLTVLLWL